MPLESPEERRKRFPPEVAAFFVALTNQTSNIITISSNQVSVEEQVLSSIWFLQCSLANTQNRGGPRPLTGAT